MKIKFSLDDESPLNNTIEIPNTIIVATAAFLKIKKYYP